jgi:hypothetical protein
MSLLVCSFFAEPTIFYSSIFGFWGGRKSASRFVMLCSIQRAPAPSCARVERYREFPYSTTISSTLSANCGEVIRERRNSYFCLFACATLTGHASHPSGAGREEPPWLWHHAGSHTPICRPVQAWSCHSLRQSSKVNRARNIETVLAGWLRSNWSFCNLNRYSISSSDRHSYPRHRAVDVLLS